MTSEIQRISLEDKSRLLIISDFNVGNLTGLLSNDIEDPFVHVIESPFGQVFPTLINSRLDCWKKNPDYAIVWTQPEAVIESFQRALDYRVSVEEIHREVDAFAGALLGIRDRVKAVFVPTWVLPSYNRGLGMLDMKADLGLSHTLMNMNARLLENFQDAPGVYVLDAQRWINSAGKGAFSPKLWYMAKIPFANEVFEEAVGDIKCALRGLMGKAKKLIVLDLDNTLWGGTVGDEGWENIRLGGHDHIGEAYVDFQRALKGLTNRGVLLAIASKNEEEVALEAFQKNPEMVLQVDDFVGWRIDWKDKAQNIVDLLQELNLGLDSVVFIDDNPAERARVREALPEVYVPEWPEDALLYTRSLLSLRCFDTPSISEEDAQRTRLYAEERKRESLWKEVGSVEDWLKDLEISVDIEELNESNLQRATQLLNKTNQMNLSTRRMSDAELLAWANQENHKFWTFRVSDRFGDAGLVGLTSIEVENADQASVIDFVLSCRVFGRKIEETAISTAVKYARGLGLKRLRASYLPTKKNKPCLDFWENSGFLREDSEDYSWDLSKTYEIPDYIRVEDKSKLEAIGQSPDRL